MVDGLASAFHEWAEVEVVGRAGSVAAARSVVTTTACDVVLLDLRLPDGSGLELLQVAWPEPRPAFLVLSSFLSAQYVSAAIALGAAGFLLKTSPTNEIVAAIVEVAEGGMVFSDEQLRAAHDASWAPLSSREHEVLAGLVRGRSNDELAGDLGVSRKTIEAYVTRLLARFGASSRTEVAIIAERGQLLDLPRRSGG